MDKLGILDGGIREVFGNQGILTNIGMNLRSCGCEVLSLDFSALMNDAFQMKKKEMLYKIENYLPGWNVYYISAFPGTEMIRKVSLRKFCNGCKENYLAGRDLGPNVLVAGENL